MRYSPINIFCLLLLFFTISEYSVAKPYITHISDTSLNETMVISGGGFNTETVKVIIHYPYTASGNEEELARSIKKLSHSYKGKIKSTPDKPPEKNTVTLEPMHSTKNSVFVKFSPGKFRVHGGNTIALVWLKDSGNLSDSYMVNDSETWFLLKKEIRPGDLNRIYGFNLKANRYLENHVFLRSGNDGETIELKKEPIHYQDRFIEKFGIQFRIPNDIEPGRYKVFVHNNSGNEYGFTEALVVNVVSGKDGQGDFYNVREYGVKGNSITDNRNSLQRVIDIAAKKDGGTVYLPPGSYKLSETINLRENVTLRGAGRGATTLFYEGMKHSRDKNTYSLLTVRGFDNTGIEDMTIRVSGPVKEIIRYFGGNREDMIDNTHLTRCRFVGGTVAVHNNYNIEINDNIFDDARLFVFNMKNAWIHGNEFTTGRFGANPVVFWASENSVIEHNNVYKSPRGFVWQVHGNFGHYHNIINANTVEDIRMSGNAGETYLFEGAGHKWTGKPDSISKSGFTVNNAGWKPDSLKNAFAVVTSGHGIGQYIRINSNTQNKVELVKPWTSKPSGDVRISIMHGVVENVFINNLDRDSDNAMMFYGAGAINNRIYRNRSENSLGIWIWSKGQEMKNIHIPDYYNIFDGNVLEDQGGFTLINLEDTTQYNGVRNLNNIFRNNFVSDTKRKRENQYRNVWINNNQRSFKPIRSAFDMKYSGLTTDSKTGSIWNGTLIERNYISQCKNGINIEKIGENTVFYRNTFFDVEKPVTDNGINSKIINNEIEKVESSPIDVDNNIR